MWGNKGLWAAADVPAAIADAPGGHVVAVMVGGGLYQVHIFVVCYTYLGLVLHPGSIAQRVCIWFAGDHMCQNQPKLAGLGQPLIWKVAFPGKVTKKAESKVNQVQFGFSALIIVPTKYLKLFDLKHSGFGVAQLLRDVCRHQKVRGHPHGSHVQMQFAQLLLDLES